MNTMYCILAPAFTLTDRKYNKMQQLNVTY